MPTSPPNDTPRPQDPLPDALREPELASGASDEQLLDALRPETRAGRVVLAFRRVTDRLVPTRLRGDSIDARRRARFVVITTFLVVPFWFVLLQQLLANGLVTHALVAGAFGVGVLACPLVLRLTRSHVVAGSMLVLLTTSGVFTQAFADAGLEDPILYWVAVLPLVGALLGGVRLALVSALTNLLGVGALFALGAGGYVFPHLTPAPQLHLAALLSLGSVTLFALIWGWVYEGITLRESRRTNLHLGRLRTALTDSEARYRDLFDRVPVGIYRSAPTGEILMANRALLRMLGYDSLDELTTETGQSVYADRDERARFVAAMEAETPAPILTTWRRKDGQPLAVREHARPVYGDEGPDGPVRYYEGVAEDTTEQQKTQAAMRRSEERFRALVQHASDLTVVLDRTGRVAYVSPATERLLGVPPEDLTGRSPLAWIHPEDRRRLAVLARRVQRRPGPFAPVEFRVLHEGGLYHYVEAAGSNLLENPHVRGLVLNMRDVTERKRAEAVLIKNKEQAEEVARLKSTFLANMSHEIRTPLTGILGFTSVLAEEVTDPQHQEFVALIDKSGQRLMDTLNSVLELARLEAGRVDLAAEPVVVAEAAREAVATLAGLARDKGLTLEARIQAPTARARIDRTALDRVLTNLVGNAIKFTDEGGVAVEVEADAHRVCLVVRDSGVGMDAEFLPRLFNEFEQESTGIARSHEGSGLGLSITRGLVERMNGTIEVESEKGRGTTFTVTFTRVGGVAPAERTAAPAPSYAPSRRVLVVDDNPNTRLLMERMLRAEFGVLAVGTAGEAMRVAEAEGPFDAVLLDINLGGDVSGEDVMQRLRQLPAYAATPLLAFTAYALPGDRERFLHSGFSGYLAKPFTKAQLLQALADVLQPAPAVAPGLPSGDGSAPLPAPAKG
ncbi:MAG TPA: PAS domain S-box protein [Rhodothermales bacterium]|nr:PAS domain S-box protein [Rhodothermales bacterium]